VLYSQARKTPKKNPYIKAQKNPNNAPNHVKVYPKKKEENLEKKSPWESISNSQ
jgi:hypothetical protein